MANNITFVDFVTPVPASWLNNVNTTVNMVNLPAYPVPGNFLNSSFVNYSYNPSNLQNWTTHTGQNFEGLSVDIGGYGTRQFGTFPLITGLTGAVNVPSNATGPQFGTGGAFYAKTASTTTVAVGAYAEGNAAVTNAQIWGFNTRTQDNGFQSTMYGYEVDINISNINSVAFGVNIVGGSTVEPTSGTYGIWLRAHGIFASPPKRWVKGIFIDDASSITGLEIGTANVPGTTAGGSMPLLMYYNPNAFGRQIGCELSVDSSGNAALSQWSTNSLLNLVVGGGPGLGFAAISMLNNGTTVQIGFFQAAPIVQPIVNGSKGGNAALTSLCTALANLGLINNQTT